MIDLVRLVATVNLPDHAALYRAMRKVRPDLSDDDFHAKLRPLVQILTQLRENLDVSPEVAALAFWEKHVVIREERDATKVAAFGAAIHAYLAGNEGDGGGDV